jgi:spore germination protein KA
MEKIMNKKFSIILPTVEENFSFVNRTVGITSDLVENVFYIFNGKIKAGLIYIELLTDKDLISRHVITPLLKNYDLGKNSGEIIRLIKNKIITAANTYFTGDMQQVLNAILLGDTALFLENSSEALIIKSQKILKRAIEKPENESTVLGSQESFTDNIDTNISLIIKRLPVRQLHIEAFTLGRLSRTNTRLVWLEGIINPKIIDDVKMRIICYNKASC